jgi:arabinofuranan 3-O-arabinosyltransferase
VSVRSWQPDQRQVSIGPGAASYLEVHENYNSGWAGALNGRQLTPVRLDGWQQGFVVPAGAGGTITLTFRPAATYHLVLIATILGVAVLLALTVWSFVGRRRRGDERDEGFGAAPLASPHGSPRAWLGVLGVTALIFVAGGPVAIVVPLLAWRAWRLPVVAFGAMAASGLLAAVRPFGTGLLGPFGWPAQACALVALAAALTPALAWRRAPVGEENR